MTSLCIFFTTHNQNSHFNPLHCRPQNSININPHGRLRSPPGPLTNNQTQNHTSTQTPNRNPKADKAKI